MQESSSQRGYQQVRVNCKMIFGQNVPDFNLTHCSLSWEIFPICSRRLASTRKGRFSVVCCSGVWLFLYQPLSRLHTLCAALQKLEQRSSTPSGLCTMDTQGCRIPTPTQWAPRTIQSLSALLQVFTTWPAAALTTAIFGRCFPHQVALSEKLHSLMTEIQEGGSNKKNFLLANWWSWPFYCRPLLFVSTGMNLPHCKKIPLTKFSPINPTVFECVASTGANAGVCKVIVDFIAEKQLNLTLMDHCGYKIVLNCRLFHIFIVWPLPFTPHTHTSYIIPLFLAMRRRSWLQSVV